MSARLRLAAALPLLLTKGVVDRLLDALLGPEEPFAYHSTTQPATMQS